MSIKELELLKSGKKLSSAAQHKNALSAEARGFCFFTEHPQDAIKWLCGIVNTEICATFDVPKEYIDVMTKARYVNINGEPIFRRDFYVPSYSLSTFKLISYTQKYAYFMDIVKIVLNNTKAHE